jgi:predicted RNA binding protein YcfA (HicA-like mRNA interferase family)
MSNKEKLLGKAKRNPSGLRFGDLEIVLRQCGWTFDHQTGSHRIWYSPRKHRISLQGRTHEE